MKFPSSQANQVNSSSNPSTPPIPNDTLSASVNAMNAMRAMDSIRNMDAMRSSVMDMSSAQPSQQQDALRMQQQAEALLRTQAEAALRLAMSQVSILFCFVLFWVFVVNFTSSMLVWRWKTYLASSRMCASKNYENARGLDTTQLELCQIVSTCWNLL